MPETTPAQLALYGVALLAIVVVGLRWLGREEAPGTPAGPPPKIAVSSGAGVRVVVHVAGEVRMPGVYRMRADARVVAAVRRAGGPTRRGDLGALNLAAKLEDGRQILVPRRAGRRSAGAAATEAPEAAGPLDLNTATAEQLDTLPGLGPTTVAAILEYRDANNGFGSVDELDQVPGIGPTTLEQLRELVRV